MSINQDVIENKALLTVKQIQEGITKLSDDDYNELTTWLTANDFERWNNQVLDNLNTGRLDTLIEEINQEYNAGLTKPF